MTIPGSPSATLRWLADTMLLCLILVVLFGVVLGRIVPLTGRETLVIGGSSMEPSIPLGAAVVIEPVVVTDIRVGDVVSLRSGPELRSIFTHRVTRVIARSDGTWFETKGDANATIDPSLTPAGHVIGRVTLTVPYAGYLLTLLSIPSGVILVILLAAVLLTLTRLLESFEIERLGRAPSPVATAPVAAVATVATAPVAARDADTAARATRARRARRARQAGSGT